MRYIQAEAIDKQNLQKVNLSKSEELNKTNTLEKI